MESMRYVSKVSACWRGPNSHETAKPQKSGCPWTRGPRQNEASRVQPSTGAVSAAGRRNYLGRHCRLESANCEATSCIQSVRRAVAGKTTPGQGQLLRLECAACRGRQRRAGGTWCVPRNTARPWQAQHRGITVAALPNPSLKRSANGRPPGPVCGEVHSPQPGPGVLPSSPA